MQVACVFVGVGYRQKEMDKDGNGEIKIETERGLGGGITEQEIGWEK